MNKNKRKNLKREIRHRRVRSRVSGDADRPRMAVFKANKHIYVQLIDDTVHSTLAFAASSEIKAKAKKLEVSKEVGKLIAQKALTKNIKSVKFDRGGFLYHGRVKALAEGAREGGLEF